MRSVAHRATGLGASLVTTMVAVLAALLLTSAGCGKYGRPIRSVGSGSMGSAASASPQASDVSETEEERSADERETTVEP